MRILIDEDDQKGARILQWGLQEEGFTVDLAADSSKAEEAMATVGYDLVILDWLLPGKQGIDICRDVRQRDASIPILMLTAKDALSDRITGLNTGADDYLTKPFAFDELVARVRALGRRTGAPAAAGTLRCADVELDRGRFQAARGGRDLGLTPREFRLLAYLLERPEQVVSRTELLEKVWDMTFDPGSNVVDVHISNLRRKLEEGGAVRLLHTVRGVGFALRVAG
jgi:DNA-binding response OmpR family regulator